MRDVDLGNAAKSSEITLDRRITLIVLKFYFCFGVGRCGDHSHDGEKFEAARIPPGGGSFAAYAVNQNANDIRALSGNENGLGVPAGKCAAGGRRSGLIKDRSALAR